MEEKNKVKKQAKLGHLLKKEEWESFRKDVKQISWLDTKEAVKNTAYTALAMLAVGCFTFGLDMGLQGLLGLIV